MTRRYRDYTRATKVVTRDAETGRVLDVAQEYPPSVQHRIVSKGNAVSDPAMRAKARRRHNEKGS